MVTEIGKKTTVPVGFADDDDIDEETDEKPSSDDNETTLGSDPVGMDKFIEQLEKNQKKQLDESERLIYPMEVTTVLKSVKLEDQMVPLRSPALDDMLANIKKISDVLENESTQTLPFTESIFRIITGDPPGSVSPLSSAIIYITKLL